MIGFSSCVQQLENNPPGIETLTVDLPARGNVKLAFSVASDKDLPLAIDVEYRNEDGSWEEASAALGSVQGLVNIQSSSDLYVFIWDSFDDLGRGEFEVKLRLQLKTPYGEAGAETEEFTLNNQNLPPSVFFGPLDNGSQSGDLSLSLGIIDKESDPVDLAFEYSYDSGSNWSDATMLSDLDQISTGAEGQLHTFIWSAKADLQSQNKTNLQLRVTPYDFLGKGEIKTSDKFAVSFENEQWISIDNFDQSSLKGDIPVYFYLFGNSNSKFNVEISYWIPENENPLKASASPRYLNKLNNLDASPDGTFHYFYWDSVKDIEKTIHNSVQLTVNMLNTDNSELEPPQSSSCLSFRVNNAKLSGGPMISEVYFGINKEGGFIELFGEPGHELDKYRVYEKWDGNKNGQNSGIAYISFSENDVINENGVFVIAGEGFPEADLIAQNFGTFFSKLPNAFSLVFNIDEGDATDAPYDYDGIGIGDFNQTGFASQGEGNPVEIPPEGKSLNRDFSNTDMDDNYYDFIIMTPNPGKTHLWEGN